MQAKQDLKHIFTSENTPELCSFTLGDNTSYSNTGDVELIEIVRFIAKKRLVARAQWDGDDVYVKLFFNSNNSGKTFLKERSILNFMTEKGILCPKIMWSGTVEFGKVFVLILSAIEPAVTLGDLWGSSESENEKKELLKKVALLLATHHRFGLRQHDLHWNNFLCKGDDIYTIDAGGMSLQERELSVGNIEKNIGQFYSLLFPEDDRFIPYLIDCYNSEATQKVRTSNIQKLTFTIRRKKHSRYTKSKIFRKCTEFFYKKRWDKIVICNRDYYDDISSLLFEPDVSLDWSNSKMLKAGNACTVWSVDTGKCKYVVKRYNLKNLWRSFTRLFRPTNGAHSWRGGHLLQCYGILTPKPVAFVEERFGIFRRRAYYITEFQSGEDFWEFFFEPSREKYLLDTVVSQTNKLFSLLSDLGIRHGDMKGQNLLVTDEGIALIDLDDLRQSSLPFWSSYCHKRDMRRFMRNWQDHDNIKQLFKKLL